MNLDHLSLLFLILIFAVCALVIWFAGVRLAVEVDRIDKHFGLGEALGGLIILAIVTNLPEIAITTSAAWQGRVEVAVGNLLGGIAAQTVVLVLLDFFGGRRENPLTSLVKSPVVLLESATVVGVLILVIVARIFPPEFALGGISPFGLLIGGFWILSLYLVKIVGAQDKKPESRTDLKNANAEKSHGKSISKTIVFAAVFAVLTLCAGFFIEISSDALAKKIGLDGVIFSATILAAATSLPEVSTGLASMKIKDYELAISDIFGGNAFLPVLFLLAELISHRIVFDRAQNSDIYLVALGIVLTLVYQIGFIVKSPRRIFRIGWDSFAVLLIYALGIAGLFFVK